MKENVYEHQGWTVIERDLAGSPGMISVGVKCLVGGSTLGAYAIMSEEEATPEARAEVRDIIVKELTRRPEAHQLQEGMTPEPLDLGVLA